MGGGAGWGDAGGETTARVNPRGSEDLSQGRDQENHVEPRQKSVSQSSVVIVQGLLWQPSSLPGTQM